MKKIIILSFLTFIGFGIQAQVNFGVKAGVNLTKFSGSDAGDNNNFLLGYAGGGLVNYKLTDAVSLQGEVLYSLEGSSAKEDGVKGKLKTGYVNIPVLAQYNHSSGFYAETGPQLGILTSAKMSFSGSEDGVDISATQDVKEQFKSINFSWGLGAGYKLSNGLGIGARYNFGITSIADSDASIKLGGLHIGLSYTFGSGE